jgi:hypothetical protein
MNLAIPGHDECTHPMLQICACMPYILVRCDGKQSNLCVHTCDSRSEIAPVYSCHCTRRPDRLMHAPAHIDATELTSLLTHTCIDEDLGPQSFTRARHVIARRTGCTAHCRSSGRGAASWHTRSRTDTCARDHAALLASGLLHEIPIRKVHRAADALAPRLQKR